MPSPHSHDPELAALAVHLAQRRDDILAAWRSAITSDPSLTTGASLPRAQLNDHIPALLVDYEQRLAGGAVALANSSEIQEGDAAAHGLHRWQQGFDLAEVTRELGRLNECVVMELEDYAAAHPHLHARVMALARRIWAQQCGVGIRASTSQYFRLQQIEASSHIKDLEEALDSLRELEQQRAELWQQAAHDLRGNLGVVANATQGLTAANASEVLRANFLRLLDRNVAALHHLLDDVTSLARLQGGHEHRVLQAIDAAALLRELCEGLQAQAQARGLFLRFSGPATLPVEGDAVKTRRIAQNLVLNAIKYTRRGGVSVNWGESEGGDTARWFMQIEDTGPGFHAGPGSELVGALGTATDQARQVGADHQAGEVSHANGELAEHQPLPVDRRQVRQVSGEGIGLSIVKRLCDLLDATVELESEAGVGTRFRILLPQRYAD
jgi:signal transduction histidine kinase